LLSQFVGIIIALLDASPSDGADNVSQVHQTVITMAVLLPNVTTLAWPILRKILSGTYLDYYAKLAGVYAMLYDKVYIRCCGTQEQKAQIAKTAAKIKAREERKKSREKQAKIVTAEMLPDTPTCSQQDTMKRSENSQGSVSRTQDTHPPTHGLVHLRLGMAFRMRVAQPVTHRQMSPITMILRNAPTPFFSPTPVRRHRL